MITEFVLSGALVYGYNRIKDKEIYKIKKIFKDTVENNNLDYKILNIEEAKHGYEILVSLYGVGFNKLENAKDLFESSLGHMVDIKQNDNLKTATVSIITKKLTEDTEFKPYKTKPYEIYAGLSYKFEPLVVDLNRFPHVLVSGQTGSGKTEEIRTILTNLLYHSRSRDINVYFSDLSDTCDFKCFTKCKQVKGYAHNIDESELLFNHLMHIYSKRLSIFEKYNCKNIKEYNALNYGKRMSYIYIVLDEIADYFPANQLDKDYEKKVICYNMLRQFIRKFRKVGMFSIVGIQRPDTTVLDPSLKSGLCTKIGFSQNNNASSLVVCDDTSLTNIENREGLFMYGNKREWFKSLYIDDKIVEWYTRKSITLDKTDFNKFLKKEPNIIPLPVKETPKPSKESSKSKVKV